MIPKAINDDQEAVKTIETAPTMSTTNTTTSSSSSSVISDNDILSMSSINDSISVDDMREDEQQQQQQNMSFDNISIIEHREMIMNDLQEFAASKTAVKTMDRHNNNSIDPEQTKLDWRRMHTVRNLVPYIENDVQQVISESSFLLSKNERQRVHCNDYALFHRSEIITGRLLGKGGFSDVYEIIGYQLNEHISQSLLPSQRLLRENAVHEVIDPITGRGRYAIKQLQGNKLLDKSIKSFQYAATDFAVEVEYLLLLNHPNILSIRGLPIDGIKALLDGHYDSYFMICDRLHETLDDRIRNNWKVHPDNCPNNLLKIQYSLQLAETIKYLHQHRIVFRDIKPENIAFSVNNINQLILFDFGLVRELPKNCNVHDIYDMSGVGTRRYMAPEVVNESKYNLKVDVYSWSMIFWEMLTHVKPYMYHSVEQHRISVCQGGERPIIDIQDWPKSVQYLLKGSWTESIQKRFDISEVCDILERILVKCPKQQQLNNNIIHQQIPRKTTENDHQLTETHHRPAVTLLQYSDVIEEQDDIKHHVYIPQTDYETLFGIPQMTDSTTSLSLSSSCSLQHTTPTKSIDGATATDCNNHNEAKATYNNDDYTNDSKISVGDLLGELFLLSIQAEDGIEVFIAENDHQHNQHHDCYSSAIVV